MSAIILPNGFKEITSSIDLYNLIRETINATSINYGLPAANSFPKPHEYPCIVRLHIDAIDVIRIDYIPMQCITGTAPPNTLNDIEEIISDPKAVVGYCILMCNSIQSESPVTTKQFYGRGSIISIVNRAFDLIAIFDALENKYQWHIASAIPLTECDLEEFATISHIPDA